MSANSPCVEARWFRVCWSVTENGRTVRGGALTGRDVPSMLGSLRDCLGIGPQDPDTVNAEIATARGWRFDSDTVSVHTHPVTLEGYRLPFTACPERRRKGAS
ncbi:hypothetical protein [Streptomyces acidiscabies]|uniref:hypothetical protein n=1 Tax=Streptomyces acidiscabies TaxID=42234 RepID=UPI000951F85A|nr:hypothetical protein [Streptomyces acidiscabies]